MSDLISVTTQMFFQPEKLQKAVDRKEQKVASATGAFARTVMKRGMRKRKGISPEGGYPYSHIGTLRNLIYFGMDPNQKGVVVGPTLFSGSKGAGSKTVPQLIADGGTVKRVIRVGKRKVRKTVTQKFKPRPFPNLTLPIAAAKLAENMEKFELK